MTVKRSSLPVRSAAAFVAAMICFAQVAMAAFAPPARTPAMVAAMAERMPCHEADPARAALCVKKNCQDDAQKHELPSLEPAPLPPPVALRVDVPSDDPGKGRDLESLRARAASPPPLVLFAHRRE